MPYLRQERKEKLNPALADLLLAIHREVFPNGPMEIVSDNDAMAEAGGMLNYAFNVLALGVLMNLPTETRYAHLERLMGTFESAKLEFWLRVVVPYEEQARSRNGDVFTDA